MSFIGQRLYEELKDTGVEVVYGIDKNSDKIYADIDIVTPEDDLEEVDAIIVTAFYFFDEIEVFLEGEGSYSLDQQPLINFGKVTEKGLVKNGHEKTVHICHV